MKPADPTFEAIKGEVAGELALLSLQGLDIQDRKELARKVALEQIRRYQASLMAVGRPAIEAEREQQLAQYVIDSLFGLGRLQAIVDDESVENIDVNGCDEVWVTYSDGMKVQANPVFDSDEKLIEMLSGAAARFGISERRFDVGHPELDLALPDGSRLSAVMSVASRPVISIRKHRYSSLDLGDLVQMGTIDDAVAEFLAVLVRARKNIVVAGAMNSGKTTLLRALASEIPARDRLVTIEQAFELGLDRDKQRHPDAIALEAREANSEGVGSISCAQLVRRSLRMNADRVIVGEVLGDEVLPMLNAMSQGRSGSMCTIHADSSSGVFRRLASYALQSPEHLPIESTNQLIAGAIHFVVFMDVEADGDIEEEIGPDPHRSDASYAPLGHGNWYFAPSRRRRLVSSIREVIDAEGSLVISNEVFAPGTGRHATRAAPLRSETSTELAYYGYTDQRLDLCGRHSGFQNALSCSSVSRAAYWLYPRDRGIGQGVDAESEGHKFPSIYDRTSQQNRN